jgi:hypothetical protein
MPPRVAQDWISLVRTCSCSLCHQRTIQILPTMFVGALLDKPANTLRIHMAHTMTYQLNRIPTSTHMGAIRNLQTYINKEHKNQELRLAQSKFTYIDEWTSNNQINHKLSNEFWDNPRIPGVRITLTSKF